MIKSFYHNGTLSIGDILDGKELIRIDICNENGQKIGEKIRIPSNMPEFFIIENKQKINFNNICI